VTHEHALKSLRMALLVCFVGAVTLIDQVWVGSLTVYSDARIQAREASHEAVLHNRLPPGVSSWGAMGANGTNVRILTVWTVEGLHRLSGVSVDKCYRLVETVSLFLFLLALWLYLRHWFEPTLAMLGLASVAAILPLTYFFHFYQPWDKPSWLAWVLLLILLRSGQLVVFALLLAVSVTIKYDTVLLPALYFLAAGSRGRILRSMLVAASLFVASFGTYYLLRVLIPGGFATRSAVAFAQSNLSALSYWNLRYPPLLALGIPGVLGAVGWSAVDRFIRACYIFGLLLLPVFFLQTNFIEVRALIPVLVLLLPAALAGFRRLSGGAGDDVSAGDGSRGGS